MRKKLPEHLKDPQPTMLEVAESNRLVEEILNLAETGEYEPLDIAEALLELLVRLTDHYARFEPTSAKRAFLWVTRNLNLNDEDLVDASLSLIMTTQNPQEAHDFITAKLSENPTCPTAELLQEFCDEISSDYNLGA